MKFKNWCQAKGYNAQQIADATGISRRTIWAYWQGARTPTRAKEKLLREKLGMPSGLFD